MQRFDDPPHMPGTGESPEERFARARPLAGTQGQGYVERRGIPLQVAHAASVRFDADYGGRPAVLVSLRDHAEALVSVHGRYLHNARRQNKMLTIGLGGGAVSVLGGWRVEPLIIVEGLFDALSLATCGWASVATIGRWVPWLFEVSAGRVVWLAFDASRSGEANAARYSGCLREADARRLPPPPLCKDWNTALVKRGAGAVTKWVRDCLSGTTPS
ncbi:MAG: toprim domain-containing protein [Blastocatellia bacterium]